MAKKSTPLGHRERQIVEAVYRLGEASVSDVRRELENPPGYSAVRAMLMSLTEKKVLKYRRDGKRYLYRPAVAKERARRTALENMLSTFFAGRTTDAMAALLDVSGDCLSDDELVEMKRMIDSKRRQQQKGE